MWWWLWDDGNGVCLSFFLLIYLKWNFNTLRMKCPFLLRHTAMFLNNNNFDDDDDDDDDSDEDKYSNNDNDNILVILITTTI